MAPLTFIAWKKYYGSQMGSISCLAIPIAYYRYEESRRMHNLAFGFTFKKVEFE